MLMMNAEYVDDVDDDVDDADENIYDLKHVLYILC